MKHAIAPPFGHRPAGWRLALAFALVYLAWGTTYLAIKEGVRTLPPALFGGVRVGLAGALLLLYQAARGQSLRLSRRDLLRTWVVGALLFVGGNGLITFAETTVPSGVAAVLAATAPLWLSLLETAKPGGERLTGRGWVGMFLGLAGVVVLCADKLDRPARFLGEPGPLLVLGSALAWSVGSFLYRNHSPGCDVLTTAAYQMFLGGSSLALLGLALGEARDLRAEQFTAQAVGAFFYLLVVSSLIAFVAYVYLLRHVSAALAGTYAYVNPTVALLVGWLVGGETLTVPIVAGMCVILAGVALIRMGGTHRQRKRDRTSALKTKTMTNDGITNDKRKPNEEAPSPTNTTPFGIRH